MCLISFALRVAPAWPLIVLANRDEFHARPTRPCGWWKGAPLLAGKDLQAGGTWLGVSATGRFAAITNYREVPPVEGERSRGELPVNFLISDTGAAEYGERILDRGERYGGFNLLLFDGDECVVASNRRPDLAIVEPGVHAISNGGFDTDWPKVERTRHALAAAIEAGRLEEAPLLSILKDDEPAARDALPDTGVGDEMERFLSPPFIRGETYGTRASTLVWLAPERGELIEHRFASQGVPVGRSRFTIEPGEIG